MKQNIAALYWLFVLHFAHAQTARMEFNLNTNPGPTDIGFVTEVDGRIYFIAKQGTFGFEPWVYDPATQQARMLADLAPGFEDGVVSNARETAFFGYSGKVYFYALADTLGYELLSYDPSTGQVRIVADINAGKKSSFPDDFAVYNGQLYFSATSAPGQKHLFRYDVQTDQVTQVLPDAPTDVDGLSPESLTVFHGKLWFWAWSATGGRGLWTHDAATGRTEPFAYPFGQDVQSQVTWMTECSDQLFFYRKTDRKLYRVDQQTLSATVAVVGTPASGSNTSELRDLTCFQEQIYYRSDIWMFRYNLATGTTSPFIQITTNGPSVSSILAAGNDLVASHYNFNAQSLQHFKRVMQGNQETWQLLPGLGDSLYTTQRDIIGTQSGIYFESEGFDYDRELNHYNLQTNQLTQVTDIDQGDHRGLLYNSKFLVPYEGRLYFFGSDTTGGPSLFDGSDIFSFDPTDASPAPTRMRDQVQGLSNRFPYSDLIMYGDQLWFTAQYQGQRQLIASWRAGSDTLTTYQIPFFQPNQSGSYYAGKMNVHQGDLYFTLYSASGSFASEPTLWKIDTVTRSATPVGNSIIPRDIQIFSIDDMLIANGLDSMYMRKLYKVQSGSIIPIALPAGLELENYEAVVFDGRLIMRMETGELYAYEPKTEVFTELTVDGNENLSLYMSIKFQKLWTESSTSGKLFTLAPGSDHFKAHFDFSSQGLTVANVATNGELDGKWYMLLEGLSGRHLHQIDTLTGQATPVAPATFWQGNTSPTDVLTYGDKLYFLHGHSYYGAEIWSLSACQLTINGTATPSSATQSNGAVITQVSGTGPYSYLWSNGATTAQLTNVTAGVYAVTVTDGSGCQTNATYTVDALLRSDGPLQPNIVLRVQPNPFSDAVTLTADTETLRNLNVQFFDLTGRQVTQTAKWASDAPLHIHTAHLPEGYYVLRLQDADTGQQWSLKLVK